MGQCIVKYYKSCCKKCFIEPTITAQHMQLMFVSFIFISGFLFFVVGVFDFSGYLMFISLIPLAFGLLPLLIFGPPAPFNNTKDVFSFQTLQLESGGVCTREKAGQFITGAFCVSAPCVILVLFHLGRILQLPTILAIVGQIIMGLSIIAYFCFFIHPNLFGHQIQKMKIKIISCLLLLKNKNKRGGEKKNPPPTLYNSSLKKVLPLV